MISRTSGHSSSRIEYQAVSRFLPLKIMWLYKMRKPIAWKMSRAATPMSALGQKRTYSLDHLVGAPEERQRDCEPEQLGGLEVQDQLDLVACCTGRSAGFSPLRIRPV